MGRAGHGRKVVECGWRSFATADMFPLAYKRHLIGMCFVPLQEGATR